MSITVVGRIAAALPGFAIALGISIGIGSAQETGSAKLGIMLDMDPVMGALIPQIRKEVRLLNQELSGEGLQEVVLREFSGASLEYGATFALPARKNALLAIESLFEEEKVDGVYWITALRGTQSSRGLDALEVSLKGRVEATPDSIPLVIRNLWQSQAQQGSSWFVRPPPIEEDPLAEAKFPSEWYGIVSAANGYMIRAWKLPPESMWEQFAYPPKITSPHALRKLGAKNGPVSFDTSWATRLERKYGLRFVQSGETWPESLMGRHWLESTTIVPFLDEESLEMRTKTVLAAMSERDSIEEDLARVEGEKVGVLFGFGFVERDMSRFKGLGERQVRDWRMAYFRDLSRIVGEARNHVEITRGKEGRVYVSEFLELPNSSMRFAEPDRYARRMARLVREDGVDAIYFFTNGYCGGSTYGKFEWDLPLIEAAIREAGVKLYVRIPYELGVVPTELHRLALASGGGVFVGKQGDSDWEVSPLSPRWTEVKVD